MNASKPASEATGVAIARILLTAARERLRAQRDRKEPSITTA